MKPASLRIGLVFDRFGDTPAPVGAPADWDAEYEPEATIAAIEDAVRELGHVPVRVGNAHALLRAIASHDVAIDAAINIAESYGTRNREAHAPVLLEMAGVPTLGSDALTLSASLDKHLAKTVAVAAGLATPAWRVVRVHETPVAPSLPAFVKPRYEGTAKGISLTSRCDTAEELHREVARQHAIYGQDLIVEAFVDGSEFTVGVVGHPPTALPVLQRATEQTTGIGLHALERHEDPAAPHAYTLAGVLSTEMESQLQSEAVLIHRALECHDYSRSDFRVDADGVAWFLEINPLPTFAPDGTFAILAELAGRPYQRFLADIIHSGLTRLGVGRVGG